MVHEVVNDILFAKPVAPCNRVVEMVFEAVMAYLGEGKRSESQKIDLLLYCLRESVVDALNLLVNVPDTQPIRQAMFVLFSQGANAFVKVAE